MSKYETLRHFWLKDYNKKFHNRLVRQAPTNYAEKILQEVSEQRALAFNPSGAEHYQMRTKPIFSHLKL